MTRLMINSFLTPGSEELAATDIWLDQYGKDAELFLQDEDSAEQGRQMLKLHGLATHYRATVETSRMARIDFRDLAVRMFRLFVVTRTDLEERLLWIQGPYGTRLENQVHATNIHFKKFLEQHPDHEITKSYYAAKKIAEAEYKREHDAEQIRIAGECLAAMKSQFAAAY